MIWQFNIYAYILFLTAIIALGGAYAAWQRRPMPGSIPMALLMTAIFFWTLGNALEIAVADRASKIFWAQVQYLGVTTVPVFWLLLVLQFTGLDRRWLTQRRVMLMFVEPLAILLLACTNGVHGWIWTDVSALPSGDLMVWKATYGGAFWVHLFYSYFQVLVGMLLLLRAAIQYPHPYRDQALVVLLGGFVPWVSNAFSVLDFFDPLPVDLTPFGFLVAGSAAFWGLFKYKLVDLVPVAREALVDSMDDAMIAMDSLGRMIDVNPAARHLLGGHITGKLGKNLSDILPGARPLSTQIGTASSTYEIEMDTPSGVRWYDVKISPLNDPWKQDRGQMVVLRDISERKQLEASLEKQVRRINQLLEVARVTTKNPSLSDTMHDTLTVALATVRAETGVIILLNEKKEVVHSIFECQAEDTVQSASPRLKEGFIHHLLSSTQTLLVHSLSSAPPWLTQDEALCVLGSALGVPIQYGENVLGGLLLLHSDEEHFTEEDVEMLTLAARQMALPLANAIVYENQRVVAQQQTTLFNALQALQHPMLLHEACQETVNVFARLTQWPVVALLAPDVEDQVTITASAGPLSGRLSALVPKGATRLPLETISHDVFPSMLLLPLKSRFQRLLLIASDVPRAFDEETRLLASSLGNVATLVLRNARLYDSVSSEQQRLAAIIQTSRDGIILVSPDNEILVMSHTAVRYLGLEGNPDQWVHRILVEALVMLRTYAPDAVKATLAEVRRIRRGDQSPGEGDYEISGRAIHWMNLPVTYGSQSLGRLLVLRDVTEDRQLEQMREDLTYTMVHDLRNPLTSIHSAIWLLNKQLKPDIPENYHTILDIAQHSTQQLINLVNAILDISRLESGRLPLDIEPFTLSDVAASVLTIQTPLATEKSIHLDNQIDPFLPQVRADRDLISRVVQNLVGNAIKFTPLKGRISLSAHVHPENQESMVISVSDTGPGIPSTIKEQLFQKFVTGMQEGRGTGLGLAFCKMVVEAHHERIWVEDAAGTGTTFSFTLPIAQTE